MEASFANSILADSPMAVVAIDGRGAIRSANAKARAFFGRELSVDEQICIVDLIPDLNLEVLQRAGDPVAFNALGHCARNGAHLQARRADGSEAFVDVKAAGFTHGGEDLITLFIQDMTAIVEAETALQDLRMQITYNWRLNSLAEMASMVAHELNQPLSAILNFLEAASLLVDRPEIDRSVILELIGSASGQARRGGDVIRRLGTLMARDTGFHADESVSELVAEIMPILDINARELGAAITVDIPADGHTRCDRVQVQQLIINLVRNALDAPSTDGSRQVLITGQQNGSAYTITVEDNGPGVAATVVPRLFEPLSSTKPGGMGLGLSICRKIVEAHSGAIGQVESRLGGAGFSFTLNSRKTYV